MNNFVNAILSRTLEEKKNASNSCYSRYIVMIWMSPRSIHIHGDMKKRSTRTKKMYEQTELVKMLYRWRRKFSAIECFSYRLTFLPQWRAYSEKKSVPTSCGLQQLYNEVQKIDGFVWKCTPVFNGAQILNLWIFFPSNSPIFFWKFLIGFSIWWLTQKNVVSHEKLQWPNTFFAICIWERNWGNVAKHKLI